MQAELRSPRERAPGRLLLACYLEEILKQSESPLREAGF